MWGGGGGGGGGNGAPFQYSYPSCTVVTCNFADKARPDPHSHAGDVMHLSILGPPPPYWTQVGLAVGINPDLHVNFDPRGGAFDLSPHNL